MCRRMAILGIHLGTIAMTGDLDVRVWKLNPPP